MNTRFTITFTAFFILAIIAMPNISHAFTNDQLLLQIAQLLSRVQSLQSQLQQIDGGQTPGPVVGISSLGNTQATSFGTCKNLNLIITSNLARGSRNSDVKRLQQFLTSTGDYTYGKITGYYGVATEAAVKRWQFKTGLVTGGSPRTTGFGVVGPKTRKAMSEQCVANTTSTQKPKQIPQKLVLVNNLVVTPTVGQSPLQVIATFAFRSSSCSSFSLNWGDGTRPLSFDAGGTSVCTKDIAYKRATHTYNTKGTHRIALRVGRGALSSAPIVKQTDISVGDTAPSDFSLSPTSGSTPLATSITFPVIGSTCTSYEADWGDGKFSRKEAVGFTNCSKDSGTQSLTHTYTNAGTYVVKFKTGRAPISKLKINEQWRVFARDDIKSGSSILITPTSGTAPTTVTVDMFGFGDKCTSYQLDWGDSSSVQSYNAQKTDCGSQKFKNTFAHTYISAGNYFIKTKLGRYSKLQDLPINSQNIIISPPTAITPTTVETPTPNCQYSNTPVCGEVVSTCPTGYVCSKVYKTYSNRCKLEDASSNYVSNGKCRL